MQPLKSKHNDIEKSPKYIVKSNMKSSGRVSKVCYLCDKK